jgi:hypothetical protein
MALPVTIFIYTVESEFVVIKLWFLFEQSITDISLDMRTLHIPCTV